MNCEELGDRHERHLDGELGPEEAARVAMHLEHCTGCRDRDARAHALRSAIRSEARRYTAPPELAAAIRRDIGVDTPRRMSAFGLRSARWSPLAIAASLMLAVVTSSGVTATYLSGQAGEDHVVQDVIASHIRSLMADHLTDVASSDQHTVKPWFSGRVDMSPPAIDLASAGFPLIGGRLDYVDERPCAALVYRHDKHVINVLVWAGAEGDAKPTESYSRQGYNLVHFTADNLDYWAVSDLNRAELNQFASRLMVAARNPDARS
jgi:anti-sigma factor RsiW